jgi:hypothetical protein
MNTDTRGRADPNRRPDLVSSADREGDSATGQSTSTNPSNPHLGGVTPICPAWPRLDCPCHARHQRAGS